MELDILKQNTTWNDASASINNNFAKVKTALEQGGGGGGEKEVHVGDEQPTDESVLLWVDTSEEGDDVTLADVAISGSYNDLKDKPEFATVNGERIDQGGNIEIRGGSSVTVDKVMSDTSENAIANKTVKSYIDEEVEGAKEYAEGTANDAEKYAKGLVDDVNVALGNKVDKIDGKGLSTEDFTTLLKSKLEGLSNYDDTEVRTAVTALQNSLDAIVNGDATSAIDSIKEILDFLSTIADTDTLAGIVANLEESIRDAKETKEIYVGDEPPTDENITLWIDTDEEGEGLKVDDALSGNSVNPVQNKVITAKFESIDNMIGDALTWLDDINGEVI